MFAWIKARARKFNGALEPIQGQKVERVLHPWRIASWVKKLAKEIKAANPEGVVLVGVLNGAFIFTADLARALGEHCIGVEFVKASSYKGGTESTGEVEVTLLQGLAGAIKGKNVVLVDDIYDTGQTLHYIKRVLLREQPKRLSICTLFVKQDEQGGCSFGFNSFPRYFGPLVRGFVIGYGLDYGEGYRGLPGLYHIKGA